MWTTPSGALLDGPGLTLTALNVTQRMRLGEKDVGDLLTTVLGRLDAQQTRIDDLAARNASTTALLQQYEQRFEQLQQTINEQQTTIEDAKQEIATLTQTIQQQQAVITFLGSKLDALLTPTIVEAVADSEQATVRWSLAATTVTASPGGATCTTDGLNGEQQCIIAGLSNGQSYTFTAQLSNAAGLGGVSAPSAPLVPFARCRSVTVGISGDSSQGAVTVSPPSRAGGCMVGEYQEGTSVTVTASLSAGFGVIWSGPAGGVVDDALLTFTLSVGSAAVSVVASFSPCVPVALSVADGAGTVEALPNRSPGCASGSFAAGGRVNLVAIPADGWLIKGWSGSVVSGSNASSWSLVVPPTAVTVQAHFGQCFPLTITTIGGKAASVVPSQSPGCASEGLYFAGTVVLLMADPAEGFVFDQWSGAVTDSSPTLPFTVPALPASINATFHPLPIVYGQPSLTSGVVNNPSADKGGLNLPFDLVFDMSTARNVMFISDLYNNRVLQYEVVGHPLDTSPLPVRVIGQADLSGTASNRGAGTLNPAANSLYYPYGLACDAQGGLYVTDNGNNRALYFPFGADTATRVYGQSGSFTTSNYAVVSADTLSVPCGIALAPDGVYISDGSNQRVLFFPGNSTTATRVYGQTDFFTKTTGTSASKLFYPTGLAVDGAGGLYIADRGNNRVVYYAPGQTTAASRVCGQGGSFTSKTENLGGVSASSLCVPYEVALAPNGTLYISDYGSHRIVAYAPGDSSAAYRV